MSTKEENIIDIKDAHALKFQELKLKRKLKLSRNNNKHT